MQEMTKCKMIYKKEREREMGKTYYGQEAEVLLPSML